MMNRMILAAMLALFAGGATAEITPEAQALIDAQLSRVSQVSPADLNRELEAGKDLVLIDVRQDGERKILGMITLHDVQIPRGYLEIKAYGMVPDRDASIVVYCGKGVRSAFAANTLTGMGYSNVRNLEGGAKAWKAAGLPTLEP